MQKLQGFPVVVELNSIQVVSELKDCKGNTLSFIFCRRHLEKDFSFLIFKLKLASDLCLDLCVGLWSLAVYRHSVSHNDTPNAGCNEAAKE